MNLVLISIGIIALTASGMWIGFLIGWRVGCQRSEKLFNIIMGTKGKPQ